MTLADSIKDNGVKSRKFILTALSLTLVLAGALILPEAIYLTYISGILGVLTIFISGNVGNKIAAGKVEAWTSSIELTRSKQEATIVSRNNADSSADLSNSDLTKGD